LADLFEFNRLYIFEEDRGVDERIILKWVSRNGVWYCRLDLSGLWHYPVTLCASKVLDPQVMYKLGNFMHHMGKNIVKMYS